MFSNLFYRVMKCKIMSCNKMYVCSPLQRPSAYVLAHCKRLLVAGGYTDQVLATGSVSFADHVS